MAVFQTIASYIVGAFIAGGQVAAAAAIGTLTATGLAVSIVAGGLAIATGRALGVFKPPKIEQGKDPGVKIQLPPATDNKIPVLYGSVFTGGIIVDAGIKNQNNTMVYVMCISEKTDSGTFSIQEIYRDDQTLNFGTGANAHIVQSVTDPNATASNRIAGKMRCRVYAGGTASGNQIFPTGVGVTPVAATTLLPTITANTSYQDLVYAVFEVDYDPENNLVGLGAINFKMTNSLNEPSNVMLDYLRSDRYGAKLSNADLDLTSFDSLYDYSTAQVDYITTGNITQQHDRWKIDGMLSTYQTNKTNIDELCMSCATYFTYNPKQGKFAVIPNREATAGEKANAFVFNDENIIGKIDITSTELYSLYNGIEAEYPSFEKKDQTNIVIVSTPSGDRNTNEPDNVLNAKFNLVNDRSRVENLANIDLRQSRFSTVLTFDADYSAIQVDVGDVVKVTSSLYGFSEKLFRCMRVTEKESNDAMLMVNVILLEYDDTIYTHNTVQSDGAVGLSGIPGWWGGIVGNANVTIPGNVIVTDPVNANANVVDPGTGNIVGNIDYGNIDWANINLDGITTKPDVPITNIPVTTPNTPGIENMVIDMGSEGGGYSGVAPYRIPPPDGSKYYEPNANYNLSVPTPSNPRRDARYPASPLEPDFVTNIDVSGEGGGGQWQTPKTRIPNVTMSNPGRISTADIQDIGVGLQNDQDLSNTNVSNAALANTDLGTANSLVAPVTTVDLGGADQGTYSAINNALAYGTLNPTADTVSYLGAREIGYKEFDVDAGTGALTANANSDVSETYYGSGVQVVSDNVIPPISDNFDYTISEARGNAIATGLGRPPASDTKVYLPNTMSIYHFANSTLSNTVTDRSFEINNADKRQTKADAYRGLIP